MQRQHIANSSYHSLQVKVERSLSTRFSLLASFVWSKSIDDADSVIPGLFESVRRAGRAQSAAGARPLVRQSGPAHHRRVCLPPARCALAGPLLRNWTLSGAVTLQDGTPVNPFYFALDFANSGTHNRPNIVPGPVSRLLPRSQRTADHFFNTDAFTAPAPFTFGNAGTEHHPGPGNNIFDFALQREFRVREGHAIRLPRREFQRLQSSELGHPGTISRLRSVLRQDLHVGRAAPHAVRAAVRFLIAESAGPNGPGLSIRPA